VFAFNVFEHLADPETAAQEIHRVLKPGGAVAIHTAFLQAMHEEPAHFYNTTEYGLREWFADFEIEKLSVSPNFSPGMMLAYLMSSVLAAP
jgi:ubiquinone/menaquinone biosynthesis C-methylase UbiE